MQRYPSIYLFVCDFMAVWLTPSLGSYLYIFYCFCLLISYLKNLDSHPVWCSWKDVLEFSGLFNKRSEAKEGMRSERRNCIHSNKTLSGKSWNNLSLASMVPQTGPDRVQELQSVTEKVVYRSSVHQELGNSESTRGLYRKHRLHLKQERLNTKTEPVCWH